MTPGEITIYDYIVERNAHYACVKIKIEATERVLNTYAKNEMERMRELEPKVWQYVLKEFGSFPLAEKYLPFGVFSRGGIFGGIFSDICNGIQYECCSQGQWKIDPLSEKCIPITYGEFDEKLGVSKDVAKTCLQRLEDRGKINRKRVMGGYSYTPIISDIKNKMMECPGEWKPMHFNPQIMDYEVDKSLFPIIEHAQEGMECFQSYYERTLKNVCED